MLGKLVKNNFCGFLAKLMRSLEELKRVGGCGWADRDLFAVKQVITLKECEINAHKVST